ncbi:two-component sensor histidine kinase [Herbaspirillum sp. meg3]|uniref:sensor histidine kinase n=1 Tax=Herbaspirillum sp. meg3 TaxID=2025949 RepID=UPI000B98C357|nr:two-component sensor histidine kinase [Herbaspirillum sp. meg3]
MILWILIATVALILAWLLLQLSRQGASSQIAQARARVSASCETIRVGASRARTAMPKSDTSSSLSASAAQAVIDLALNDESGVEGGFWQAGQGVVAYAFPTYDGTGIKRDPPSAELERIVSTAERARDSSSLITDVRPGLREAVVFAACPVEGNATSLVAWTLKRVPLFGVDVLNQLLIALGLLLGVVIVSGAWLGWTITRWRKLFARLSNQLTQAERLATLGRVSAGLAHEIRNPLGAMRMKAENALAAPSDVREARVAGALEAVLSQTARLESLVSSLLALTQPFHVERRPVDLYEWINERRQAHIETALKNGVRIDLVVDPDTALLARRSGPFDPEQMARALDNLILNALAHTDRAGRIELGARRLQNGALQLWITDDGAGIPVELRDSLFEPFATARPGGTGLGLALVREIMQAHGGRITLAETSPGARFEMELPWHVS